MPNKLKTMSVSCGRARGHIRAKTVSIYINTEGGHRSICVKHRELADLYSVVRTLHTSLSPELVEDAAEPLEKNSAPAESEGKPERPAESLGTSDRELIQELIRKHEQGSVPTEGPTWDQQVEQEMPETGVPRTTEEANANG